MHDIHINPIKNRMYVHLKDKNTIDTPAYVNAIENACKKLTYNFSCVAVLNKKGNVCQSDIDLLFNTVGLIYAYGAGRIILVRKKNGNFDFLQPNILNFKAYFMVENARNIKEAEKMLDQRNSAVIYAQC